MQLKKLMIEVMVFFVLGCFLCACGKTKDQTRKTTKDANKEIMIGGDNYPPFNYTDENGNMAGIDVEFAREAFHRMGYKGEHCVHGFRASAKTILMQKKEFRYSDTATELQLAHKLVDSYGRAYNRMTEIEERTRMMNDWGDYLESLIVPLDDNSENNA